MIADGLHYYFTLHYVTVSGREGCMMLKSASEKSARARVRAIQSDENDCVVRFTDVYLSNESE